MTQDKPEGEKGAKELQKFKDCGGTWWFEGVLRLAGTVGGIVLFGVLMWGLLYVEIRLVNQGGLLPQESLFMKSRFMKALILAALLVLLLLVLFGIASQAYRHWPRENGKPTDTLYDIVARRLDRWFRDLDWCVNRGWWTDGDDKRLWSLPGHSAWPTVLAILMAGFIALGPRIPPLIDGIWSYGSFILASALILMFNWWCSPRRLQFLPHLLVLLSLSLVVFFLPGAEARRVVDAGPYQHLLIPLFWLAGAGILLAGSLGFLLFQKYAARAIPEKPKASGVPCEDGLVSPLRVPGRNTCLGIDLKRFFRSLLKAPFFHFIEIAWWPAIAVVFVADLDMMGRAAFFLGVAAWVFYALGEMHEELDSFLGVLRRLLFTGGQLLVSIAVIVLAAGRLLDNSYIRTLIEGEGPFGGAGPFGGMNNWVLLYYLASAYVLFWYLEYWINRFSAERLLAMFSTDAKVPLKTGPISMFYRESKQEEDGLLKEGVVEEGALAAHQAARYALVGDDNPEGKGKCVKRILGRVKLVREAIRDECRIDVSGRWIGAQGVSFLLGREFKLVIVHRLRFYFTTIYLALAAAVGSGTYWAYTLPQRAELAAQLPGDADEGLFNLRENLFSAQKRGQRPAILLAASGGGTRAAVYTYSVLRGMHDLGVDKDLVLASGISGGSTAIAYFAMHRDELIRPASRSEKPSPKAAECLANPAECEGWERFGAVMSAPFIQDALRGLTEGRMAWGCPGHENTPREGLRLGILLQESFDRWFTLNANRGPIYSDACAEPRARDQTAGSVTRLGNQGNIGLLFNSALAGIFDKDRFCFPDGRDCRGMSLSEAERLTLDEDRGYETTAEGKGGRLVLTNLKVSRKGQDGPEGPFPDESDALQSTPGDLLTYKIVNDPKIPLVSAAALSANFPPVFPNAAVDVTYEREEKESMTDGKQAHTENADENRKAIRYWVTDGGATDNRGIISLLYALEGAIREELRCAQTDGEKAEAEAAEAEPAEARHSNEPTVACQQTPDPVYPPIHIVIAEASGADPTYKQDRGISTALGGAERFASQMMVDKVEQLRDLYAELKKDGNSIYVHKLAMPLTLRSAGGIGTHWMLPKYITLRPPFGLEDAYPEGQGNTHACWPEPLTPVERFRRLTEPGVDITGEQAKALVEALHKVPWSADAVCEVCALERDEDERVNCRENLMQIWQRWICKDPQETPHPDYWYRFVERIKSAGGANVGVTYTDAVCKISGTLSCDNSLSLPETSY